MACTNANTPTHKTWADPSGQPKHTKTRVFRKAKQKFAETAQRAPTPTGPFLKEHTVPHPFRFRLRLPSERHAGATPRACSPARGDASARRIFRNGRGRTPRTQPADQWQHASDFFLPTGKTPVRNMIDEGVCDVQPRGTARASRYPRSRHASLTVGGNTSPGRLVAQLVSITVALTR